jgi:hypothetical protein
MAFEASKKQKRRKMSRSILLAARRGGGTNVERVTIGELLSDLGDRSFGWCLIVFGIVSLLPLPIGSNMLTALPLILIAGQMAVGYRHVHLPRVMTERSLKRQTVRATVHRLRFVLRPLERIAHPRRLEMFSVRRERLLGVALLVFSLALFLPIPLSGYIPAISIFVIALGLVERDGLVVQIGLVAGVVSVVVTAVVGGFIAWELISFGQPPA